jgi:hypothetical protein
MNISQHISLAQPHICAENASGAPICSGIRTRVCAFASRVYLSDRVLATRGAARIELCASGDARSQAPLAVH